MEESLDIFTLAAAIVIVVIGFFIMLRFVDSADNLTQVSNEETQNKAGVYCEPSGNKEVPEDEQILGADVYSEIISAPNDIKITLNNTVLNEQTVNVNGNIFSYLEYMRYADSRVLEQAISMRSTYRKTYDMNSAGYFSGIRYAIVAD